MRSSYKMKTLKIISINSPLALYPSPHLGCYRKVLVSKHSFIWEGNWMLETTKMFTAVIIIFLFFIINILIIYPPQIIIIITKVKIAITSSSFRGKFYLGKATGRRILVEGNQQTHSHH